MPNVNNVISLKTFHLAAFNIKLFEIVQKLALDTSGQWTAMDSHVNMVFGRNLFEFLQKSLFLLSFVQFIGVKHVTCDSADPINSFDTN